MRRLKNGIASLKKVARSRPAARVHGEIEDNLLRGILIGMVLVPTLVTLINLSSGANAIPSAASAIVFLMFFILHEIGVVPRAIRVLTALSLILGVVPAVWIVNSGLSGGFGYFVVFFSLIVVSIARKGLERRVLLTLYFGVLLSLLVGDQSVLPQFYPELDTDAARLKATYSLLISAVATIVLFMLYVDNYRREHQRAMDSTAALKSRNLELHHESRHDVLTGISNRRDATERLAYAIEVARRNQREFSLLMCDVDRFKSYNDTFGHACGDYLLRCVAEILHTQTRAQDIVARWGGEEFLIIMPETDIEGAMLLADKLRRTVRSTELEFEGRRHQLELTIGVTARGGRDMQAHDYLREADQALYLGKAGGRNKVVRAEFA